MNKKDIYNKMLENVAPYQGRIYLACCIGVEYDSDIVSHFIKYYRDMGVDKFLIILNTINEDSKKLRCVQKILRILGIEEEKVWIGKYDHVVKTEYLMKLLKDNTSPEDWVLTIDIDEFQEYPCDLRKFIAYLDRNEYECVHGFFVDRLSSDGTIIDIPEGTNLFEAFPLKKKLVGTILNDDYFAQQKVMIHKSYIKLHPGQHRCDDPFKYKTFPEKLDVHHFKWRGNYLKRTEDRIKYYISRGYEPREKGDVISYHLGHTKNLNYLTYPMDYYKKNGSFLEV